MVVDFQYELDELLALGTEDWLHFLDILNSVKRNLKPDTDEQTRLDVLAVIRTLLKADYVEIGDVYPGGFVAWNMSIEQALDNVIAEWNIVGEPMWVGEVCWLSLTPEGKRVGEAILHTWRKTGHEEPYEIHGDWIANRRYGLTDGLLERQDS